MTGQVVVTRPLAEAENLAQEIARLGFAPLLAPMLEIHTLQTPIPSLERYAALAFTSANGVRAFAERSGERGLAAYAVGDATAAALRMAGFQNIQLANGDADALADLIAQEPVRGTVLHISGRAIARDLGVLLKNRGVHVDRVETYDARPAAVLPPDLVAALYACTVGYVLFYSTRTAQIFGTLANEAGLTRMLRSITAICLSAQVAVPVSVLPWRSVAIAPTPRTPDMLALLAPTAAPGLDWTPANER
jgi:uroporphyrinogen-III synthase